MSHDAPAAKHRLEIAWTGSARRALQWIPEKVAAAAIEFIYGSLAEQPHRGGHPLRHDLEGLHSARRGDHHIIYRIDDAARRVTIIAIAHRADVYRRNLGR